MIVAPGGTATSVPTTVIRSFRTNTVVCERGGDPVPSITVASTIAMVRGCCAAAKVNATTMAASVSTKMNHCFIQSLRADGTANEGRSYPTVFAKSCTKIGPND